MPVIFSYSDEGNYLKVDYIGRQTDEGILSAWKQFFDTVGEVRGVNVMTVLTDSDFSDVSMEALNQLNEMAAPFTTSTRFNPSRSPMCPQKNWPLEWPGCMKESPPDP